MRATGRSLATSGGTRHQQIQRRPFTLAVHNRISDHDRQKECQQTYSHKERHERPTDCNSRSDHTRSPRGCGYLIAAPRSREMRILQNLPDGIKHFILSCQRSEHLRLVRLYRTSNPLGTALPALNRDPGMPVTGGFMARSRRPEKAARNFSATGARDARILWRCSFQGPIQDWRPL